MKRISRILLCCFASVFLLPAYCEAKEWSLNDEVYACGMSGMTLEELASAGVTLLSHAPWGGQGKSIEQVKAFLQESHRYGIKVIPYVTLYKVIDSRQVTDTYHTKHHPFYKELDLVDHPEWALIDENGNIRRPFDHPSYRNGVHQSCTNVAGLADAYVRGVKNTMELGVDGLFVDNVHPYPVCFGPKFGKHEHIYQDKDNIYTYHLALKRVYDLVKQYGADKVVMLNTGGGPRAIYADCDDGTMIESYICTFVKKRYHPQNRWNDFSQVMKWAKQHTDYIASGKGLVALSYVGYTSYPVKDDTFYCGACGKLSGFLWTPNAWDSGWATKTGDRPGNDIIRILYRANLKKPLTPIKEKDGITYRIFANGIVAVNPGNSSINVQLPVPDSFTEMCDLYSGIILPVSDGKIAILIPPESGRLYISPDAAFHSYLEECALAVKGIKWHLNKLRNNPDIPSWTICDAEQRLGQGRVTVDKTQAHSGRACLKVTSDGSGAEVWANQAGMMLLQDEPQSFSVSYWAKAEPGVTAKLLFEADFKEGGNGYWSPPEVNETEWTYRQGTYVSPKPMRDIEVFCSASYDKPGSVWFDDIVVTSAGKSDWLQNPGFEKDEDTMTDKVKNKLDIWLEQALPVFKTLSKNYSKIPSPDSCKKFIDKSVVQQNKLHNLLKLDTDKIIHRRLQNLREYTGRVISMVTRSTLNIEAPIKVKSGETFKAILTFKNPDTCNKNVQFALEAPVGWNISTHDKNKIGTRTVYKITVPKTAQIHIPVTLTALASFENQNTKLKLTILQTHGLQITDKKTQEAKGENITDDQHQKLHADPKK